MVTEMKILVFSDSHGRLELMRDAVKKERPDHIFFLGDVLRDSRELARHFPDIPMSAVRGNCDWGPGPDQLVVELSGVRFFLTHGHLYGVKEDLTRVALAGREAGAGMVCFGHTHQPLHTLALDGLWLFNPGTAGGIYRTAGYGVLTADQGKVTGELRQADRTGTSLNV